ncbi:helix-turn-helix domain-containing protein [Saccharopolyspora pogona]|uniref:helix-turn-helix domain-containing protein n=1 Tax=Saccharopolyspora pogona TaxID=333966 RepID=UPI0016873233|nr:helix-turn-helix domain-containing protein [Saccharopolyspora pogona]
MLKRRAAGHKTPYRDKIRAEIVLLAGRGYANSRIAAHVGVTVDTVRRWRDRFAAAGVDGLADPNAAAGRGASPRWPSPR